MAEKLNGDPEVDATDSDGVDPAEVPSGPNVTTDLPFPGYVATAFYRFHQTSLPRRWCLTMITWPYLFSRIFQYLWRRNATVWIVVSLWRSLRYFAAML